MSFSLDNGGSAVIFFALSLAAALYILYPAKKLRYPPGPPRWPLIGNLLDVPKPGSEWVDYHRICKKYDSDIVYLEVLGKSLLILDSIEAIGDLLDKRSNIYSSRPPFTMIRDPRLMDWGGNFIMMPYGSPWRERRRLFHSELNVRSVAWHHPQQIRGAHGLLSRLLDNPKPWQAHLQQQIGAAIMDVAYGITAVDEDPLIKLADDGNYHTADASVPGRYLVETLTWLKYVPAWVPGASFQRKAAKAKAILKDMGSIPFQVVKRAMAEGNAKPSFVTNCLQNLDTTSDVKYQEMLIEDSAGVMFIAGAETTASTLSTFILAMMRYPEVQAKAQIELDTVLGHSQLPSFGDEASLPYISAIVKESLRWEVVTPFAVPHQSTEDDEYRGFHIPAGTLVIPNSWAVLNNEHTYPDPLTFNPDRFIKDGKLDSSVPDPEAAFGYGRRICPGQHMAQGTIWINIASILACFTIQKPVDAQGQEFEPSVEYISKIVRHPEPFDCSIKPRSTDVADMIRGLSV